MLLRTPFSVVLIVPVGQLATVLAATLTKLGELATAARLTNSVSRGRAFARSTTAATASATPTTSATTLLAIPALSAGLGATLVLAFGASLTRTAASRCRIAYAIPDVVTNVGISRSDSTGI